MALIDFLRAQLDEDERVALAAGGKEWTSRTSGYDGGAVELAAPDREEDAIVVYAEGRPSAEEATHIAEFDPVRVLAEVTAKRAIITACEASYRESDDYPGWEGAVYWLAQPYADRDGWDEQWGVSM